MRFLQKTSVTSQWTGKEILLLGLALLCPLFFLPFLTFLPPFLQYICQYVVFFLLLFWIVFSKQMTLEEAFQLKKVPLFHTLGIVVSFWLLSIVSIWILHYFFGDFFGIQAQPDYKKMFGDGIMGTFFLMVSAILIAPLVEEIIFRGIFWNYTSQYLSLPVVLLATSGIFAVMHGQPESQISLLIIGMALGMMRIVTHSLIPSIAFHMFNNTFALLITLYVAK